MRRILPVGSLVVVLVFVGSLQAAEHEAWVKFLKGAWNYEWKSVVGDYSEKGEVSYTLAAGGKMAVGRVTTANGDKELETWGWRPDTKTFVLSGYSSNGSYWHYDYTDIGADRMAGTCHGTVPDGRAWRGKALLVKNEHGFEVKVDGVMEEEEIVSIGMLTRKSYDEGDETIPKEALEELGFMAGNWETTFFLDGEEIGVSEHERSWVPGEYCLRFAGELKGDDKTLTSVGMSGWNAKTRQIVEHWHTSDGLFITVRYPLAKMKEDAWHGTFLTIHVDGKEDSGRCVLKKKGKDEWVWTANWEDAGGKHVRKGVTRRR